MTLDLLRERAAPAPTLPARLWSSIVDAFAECDTEPIEFGLAFVTAWWSLSMFSDGTLFVTQTAFRALADQVTQEAVGAIGGTIALTAMATFLLHQLRPIWSVRLRPIVALAYAGFFFGIFAAVVSVLPSAPANGYHLFFTGAGVWTYIRLKHPRRRV